jgi:hypothetical protein
MSPSTEFRHKMITFQVNRSSYKYLTKVLNNLSYDNTLTETLGLDSIERDVVHTRLLDLLSQLLWAYARLERPYSSWRGLHRTETNGGGQYLREVYHKNTDLTIFEGLKCEICLYTERYIDIKEPNVCEIYYVYS